PQVYTLILEVFYKPDGSGDAERIAAARAGIASFFRALDHALARREYLCDDFSVADIGTFLTTMFATSLGTPPDPSLAHVATGLGRMMGRPSIAAEMAAMTGASQAA
ncbi:MAG TPA: hypothetical protein VGR62_23745, partial [Candidatus Binatia bacterium]|nr:hypothetical protein [Candidatus Binatia bacterium]